MDIEGFVLVGGASRRMGRDKAALVFGGTTLGRRAARVLAEFAGRVRAVGGEVEGVESVADVHSGDSGRAAIYGVHAALANSTCEWAAVLACDLPFVGAELFRRLMAIAEHRPDTQAVVPVQPDGRVQPLAAIYRREPCLRAVERSIAAGRLRLTACIDSIAAVHFTGTELFADLDGDGRLFSNINTPEDYLRLTSDGA